MQFGLILILILFEIKIEEEAAAPIPGRNVWMRVHYAMLVHIL